MSKKPSVTEIINELRCPKCARTKARGDRHLEELRDLVKALEKINVTAILSHDGEWSLTHSINYQTVQERNDDLHRQIAQRDEQLKEMTERFHNVQNRVTGLSEQLANIKARCIAAGIVNGTCVVSMVKAVADDAKNAHMWWEHWTRIATATLKENDKLESMVKEQKERLMDIRNACVEGGVPNKGSSLDIVKTLAVNANALRKQLQAQDENAYPEKIPQHTHSQKLAPAGKVAMVMLCVAVALIVVIFVKVITA